MKKCAVIFNPESGRPIDKKNIKDLPGVLMANGYEALMCPTKKAKDATDIVKNLSDDIDLVILAGGDGTLNEGITGNLKREKKLLISQLPVGTMNDVGTMYGFTKKLLVNAQMVINGTNKNIDVCMLNDTLFVYVACLGSYVDVSYSTPRSFKKKYGRLAYVFSAIHALRDKVQLFDLTYEVDGTKKSGTYSFIFITNTSRMGGISNIYEDVKLNDNKFEVILISAKKKPELFFLANKVLTGKVRNMPGLEHFKTNNFKVVFDKVPPSWVIDGEEFKHNTKSFNFRINKEINMRVPSKNIVKLFIDEE